MLCSYRKLIWGKFGWRKCTGALVQVPEIGFRSNFACQNPCSRSIFLAYRRRHFPLLNRKTNFYFSISSPKMQIFWGVTSIALWCLCSYPKLILGKFGWRKCTGALCNEESIAYFSNFACQNPCSRSIFLAYRWRHFPLLNRKTKK